MKLSKYTVFYDNYHGANADVIGLTYNTRTQGVLGVDQRGRDFINRLRLTPGFLPPVEPDDQAGLEAFTDSGIIIDKETDESRVLEDWFSEIRYRRRALQATILTTYKCNFACAYCFEERLNDRQPVMDDQTTARVIEYLKSKAVQKNSPKISLTFYGGEPLINTASIISIAAELARWTREKGIKFSFGMITNGSLVRKAIVEQLVKLGLKNLRITLDGDREVHDRRRPYLDGRGSFEHIINNIRSVIDIVKVDLSGNFDRDNLAGLHRLLDYLEQKGLNKGINSVLFAPVVSRLGSDNGQTLNVEAVGCHSLSGELAEEGLKLQKELIQRGYNVGSSVQVSACPMIRDDSTLVIDPTGDIYKCEAFVGRPQFCVGNVRTNRFNHRYYEFVTMKPWQDCLDCPYVPMCGGGCRYIAQLKHGDYTKPACDKEYYEKIFPQLLKMDYERGVL